MTVTFSTISLVGSMKQSHKTENERFPHSTKDYKTADLIGRVTNGYTIANKKTSKKKKVAIKTSHDISLARKQAHSIHGLVLV